MNPDALGRPASEAVVEGLLRSVDLPRRVCPATAGLRHVDDAADHPAIIDPCLAPLVARQVGRNLLKLLVRQPIVRQPKMIHRLLPRAPGITSRPSTPPLSVRSLTRTARSLSQGDRALDDVLERRVLGREGHAELERAALHET